MPEGPIFHVANRSRDQVRAVRYGRNDEAAAPRVSRNQTDG